MSKEKRFEKVKEIEYNYVDFWGEFIINLIFIPLFIWLSIELSKWWLVGIPLIVIISRIMSYTSFDKKIYWREIQ